MGSVFPLPSGNSLHADRERSRTFADVGREFPLPSGNSLHADVSDHGVLLASSEFPLPSGNSLHADPCVMSPFLRH